MSAAARWARLSGALIVGLGLAGCAAVPAQRGAPENLAPRAGSLAIDPASIGTRTRPVSRMPMPFFAALPRAEAPYTDRDVLRNFMSIALNAEAADDVSPNGTITISKWDGPIRYRVEGATPRDRVQIAALSEHLGRLTRLSIRESRPGERHNMDIRFVPQGFRAAEIAQLQSRGWLGPRVGRLATNWRDFEADHCFALTTRHPRTGVTGTAHIFIKDELDQRWRETCIIEELAQSLGLLNDDPRARPSIFNDDGEYLALTSHDEVLLRMLYHPMIRSGMTPEQVRPVAPSILSDVTRGRDTRT